MALKLTAFQIPHSQVGCRAARFATSGSRLARSLVARPLRSPSSRTREVFQTRAEADGVAAEVVSGTVNEVNDKTFEEVVLQSEVPVIVDFWAPWCGPCRMIAPYIEELAVEYGDKLLCVKLNTDESSGTANTYGIRSIPTVMLFKEGVRKETVIGAVPKNALKRSIDRFME